MLSKPICDQVPFVLDVLAYDKPTGNTVSSSVDAGILELVSKLNTAVDFVTNSGSFLF